eukprot:SAG11_NODE_618_length_8174_cov_41.665718_10_plen_71_part_00
MVLHEGAAATPVIPPKSASIAVMSRTMALSLAEGNKKICRMEMAVRPSCSGLSFIFCGGNLPAAIQSESQ